MFGPVWLVEGKKFCGNNCTCLVVTVGEIGPRGRAVGGTHGCWCVQLLTLAGNFFAKHVQTFACKFFHPKTKQGL